MTNIVKLDNAKIQSSYEGFDLYFDHQDKILYTTVNGLARWVGCHTQTISNLAVKLGMGKMAETLTGGGIQGVKLLTSHEVVTLLSELAKSKRTKQQTKESASDCLARLATVGNELGGMLAVAPDELAKLAINRLSTADQVESVQSHLTQHQKYLKGYHGLHGELKLRGAEKVHHATINKHNNELVGVRPGYRDVMSEREKDEMTLIQLVEKMKLEDTKTSNAWQAVNVCKSAGSQAKTALKGILR